MSANFSLPYAGLSPADAMYNLVALGSRVKILNKQGRLVTFELNEAQSMVYRKIEQIRFDHKRVRLLVLKARQQGISTLIALYDMQVAAFHYGSTTMVLTQLEDTSQALYSMIRRYHDTFPGAGTWIPTETSSAKGMTFTNMMSQVKVATAGSATVGHGLTVTNFHGSETSRWPNAALHMSGIMQAVPDTDGSSIILESTSAGRGDAWHQMWQDSVSGASDFHNIFVPWHVTKEYARRPAADQEFDDEEIKYAAQHDLDDWQMAWRQRKIATDFSGSVAQFASSYPAYADEAFARSANSFIKFENIQLARKRRIDNRGELIFGYDPAAGGADRGALCRRRGMRAFAIEYNKEPDTMVQAGMLARIIHAEQPKAVFIDATGASVGVSIVNRLQELGFKQVIPVGFGNKADNESKYINKRTEMWCRMRDWLEGGVEIPDDQALEQDLLGPNIIEKDSAERERLESKKDMGKRGVRSPDGADALALTFAFKVADREVAAMKTKLGIGQAGHVAKRRGVVH